METNKDKSLPLEGELSVLNQDRTTEISGLKSEKSKDNKDSINNSNNSSYIQLTNENSLNLEENNNSINFNNNQFKYNPINQSRIKRSTQLKIFIPLVSAKILIPAFFMLRYTIYCFENEEDQNYCKYSVWILIFLIFLCYFLAIVKSNSQSNVDKYFDEVKNNILSIRMDNPGNELQDLNSDQWGDCLFCKSKKFIRSSHCRTCNKCILLRDHHCPYLGSCVGFKNMQYFFNFLFWAEFGLIFYIISFIKFNFFSDIRKYIVMEIYIKIFFYIDSFFTIFFIFNIMCLMGKLFVNIYNNCSQLEWLKLGIIEYYCPICPKCVKDYKIFNIKPQTNKYNIGFLANIYYIIGPTPFHLIFPLPKYNNYILDENCPVFKKLKFAERLEIFKFLVRKDHKNINIFENDESSPQVYVKACHKFYDGKKII